MATPKVDQRMFDCVKIMIKGGAKRQEIADYMKLSEATVKRIDYSENLEEYQAMCAAISLKAKRQVNEKREREQKAAAQQPESKPQPEPQVQVVKHEHQQTITMVANHYMMEELKQQTEYLKVISNKLLFLIDELTMPKKKEKGENENAG